MRKYKYFLIILLMSNIIFAQNIIIYDSIIKSNLPYVAIQYGNNGLYTDENGNFDKSEITSDSLTINYFNYKRITISKGNLKDTLFIEPSPQKLKEIVIKNTYKEFEIKQPKSTNIFGDFPINNKTEIVSIVIPKKNTKNTLLKEISFRFKKLKSFEISDDLKANNNEVVIRLNIYSVNANKIENKIYSSQSKIINSTQNEKIIFDIEKEFFELSEKGLGFAIEFIGFPNKKTNLSTYIRPVLTKKELYKDIEVNTFFKFTINDSETYTPLNEIIGKHSPNKKEKEFNRNLIMGFIFLK